MNNLESLEAVHCEVNYENLAYTVEKVDEDYLRVEGYSISEL